MFPKLGFRHTFAWVTKTMSYVHIVLISARPSQSIMGLRAKSHSTITSMHACKEIRIHIKVYLLIPRLHGSQLHDALLEEFTTQ